MTLLWMAIAVVSWELGCWVGRAARRQWRKIDAVEFLPNLVDPSASMVRRLEASRATLDLYGCLTTDINATIKSRIQLAVDLYERRRCV